VRKAVPGLLLALLAGCSRAPEEPAGTRLLASDLVEVSGLAASHAHPWLWAEQDSGNDPVLYAIGTDGSTLGTVRVQGATNTDWEDIALYEQGGQTWILLADTGDNLSLRSEVRLYIVPEPDPHDATVPLQQTIRVVYPNGPHDCEAVAVDPAGDTAWLVTKRDTPPQIFSVPLAPTDLPTVVAAAHGTVPHIPPPTAEDLQDSPRYGQYRSQPTALDLRPDVAVLQTYKDAYLFRRAEGQDWGAALAGTPTVVDTPQLPQTESATFTPDGHGLWITTEQAPAPLDLVPLPGAAP